MALGYLGPANLAAVASEYVTDKGARILDAASGAGMVGEEVIIYYRLVPCLYALG